MLQGNIDRGDRQGPRPVAAHGSGSPEVHLPQVRGREPPRPRRSVHRHSVSALWVLGPLVIRPRPRGRSPDRDWCAGRVRKSRRPIATSHTTQMPKPATPRRRPGSPSATALPATPATSISPPRRDPGPLPPRQPASHSPPTRPQRRWLPRAASANPKAAACMRQMTRECPSAR